MKNRTTNQHNIVIATPAPKNIGIIGGRGQMGRLLEREFRATGYTVRTSGKEDGISERTLRRLNYHLLRESDVLVIAVPIPELCKGLENLFGPRAMRGLRGKLVFDIASTKCEPMHEMAAAAGASVVGCHPLFGPLIQQMTGKHVVLCPLTRGSHVLDANTQAWAAWLAEWWKGHGAAVHFLTPEEHDRLMAIIQIGVLAPVTFFAAAVERLSIPMATLMEISTPNSLVFQAITGRMLSAAMASTYAFLATGNKFSADVTEAIRDAAADFHKMTTQKDAAALERHIKALADGISPAFREKALALTKKFEAAVAA